MRNSRWFMIAAGLLLAGAGAARADTQAELKGLVTKAVKAMGGKAKLAKFRAATSKGKGTIFAPVKASFNADISMQIGDRYHFTLELSANGMSQTQEFVVNGKKGWIKVENTVAMPQAMRAFLTDSFYAIGLATNPLEMLGKGVKLSALGEIKVNDKAAVGVRVSRKGRRDVSVYFDKKTALPCKCETVAKDFANNKEGTQEIFFSAYKKFEGVNTYTKMVWKKAGKKYLEQEFSEVTPAEKLDDSVFAKP